MFKYETFFFNVLLLFLTVIIPKQLLKKMLLLCSIWTNIKLPKRLGDQNSHWYETVLKKTWCRHMTLWCVWFFFFSYIGKTDSITISIWNHKKIHKRQGAGFLGCIRLLSNAISRLKDTGCKSVHLFFYASLILNGEKNPYMLVRKPVG